MSEWMKGFKERGAREARIGRKPFLVSVLSGAFWDAAAASLLAGALMSFVFGVSGERLALELAASLGLEAGASGLARTVVIGGFAALVAHLTVAVAVVSALLRTVWPPVRWLARRGASIAAAALQRSAA